MADRSPSLTVPAPAMEGEVWPGLHLAQGSGVSPLSMTHRRAQLQTPRGSCLQALAEGVSTFEATRCVSPLHRGWGSWRLAHLTCTLA